jgi:hypothetical protein
LKPLDRISKKIGQVILPLAEYLLRRQVFLSLIEVRAKDLSGGVLCKRLDIYQKKSINLSFRHDLDTWSIKNGENWEQLLLGKLVSIPIFGIKYEEMGEIYKREAGLWAKIYHYSSYPDFFSRCFQFLISSLSSKKTRDVCNEVRSRSGGLTFRVVRATGEVLNLKCLDFGGIYSKHLNAEGVRWPDQVAVGYYSTEYASYVFHHMYEINKEVIWLKALEDSLVYFINTYKPYKAIAFDHFEFKLLPMLLLLAKLKDSALISEALVTNLESCLGYNEKEYTPVNVYAMRIASLSVGLEGEKFRLSKIDQYLRILEANITPQGLIRDNYLPAYKNSADLTYHQFSLACLVLAGMKHTDSRIQRLISKGLAFSRYVRTQGCHVSYYGRGSNNIYHLASYVFAESCASDTHFYAIDGILDLYLSYLNEDCGLPSALNRHFESRMGWNHCNIPYIGQSLFFLALSLEVLEKEKKMICDEKIDLGQVKHPDYLKISNNTFEFICGRGSDTYVWSDGVYLTGCPGLASVSIAGQDLLASLGYNFRVKEWITDLPLDVLKEPVFGDKSAKLRLLKNGVELSYKDRLVSSYKLEERQLQLAYEFSSPCYSKYLSLLPLRMDLIKGCTIYAAGVLCLEYSGFVLEINIATSKGIILREIENNPFGRVLFPQVLIEPGVVNFSYEIRLL